jgi:hypothetical protein
LVHRPKILVATSPRGSDELFDLALRTTSERQLCVLWAGSGGGSHRKPPRIIHLQDGRIRIDQES